MDVGEYIRKKNRETEKRQNSAVLSPQEAIKKYSGYSEEELMRELFALGSLSSGKISPEELDNFYFSVKNFLTPEQSERMRELITQLKNS